MGTPANDAAGWAGWAISSFTNKLSAASGDITAGKANGDAAQRSSSVPPPIPNNKPSPLSPKPGMTVTKSSTNIPTIVSPDPAAAFNDEDQDFGDDWGGFGDDTSTTKDKQMEEDDDPWGTPSIAPTSKTSSAFDDKGEPDFAGWLAAQNNSKKPAAAKALPKGLAKGSAAVAKRPIIGGRSSTTGSATRKVVAPTKKEEPKKEETKSKEDEEEGWGDAW